MFVCPTQSAINTNQVSQLFENRISSLEILLTTKEAAEYLRTSPKQLRNWVYQGKVKAYKLLGKSLRFKASELGLLIKGGHVWQ